MTEENYYIQDEMTDPIAFTTKTDEDNMYVCQSMKQLDKEEFVRAVIK